MKKLFEKVKRLVVKIGSSLLIEKNKFNKEWLESLIQDLLFLRKKNRRYNCSLGLSIPWKKTIRY